jgi:hypothetical protein
MPQIHHAFDIARPHGSRHRFLLGLRVHVASSALQTRQAVPVVATEERIKPRRWPSLAEDGPPSERGVAQISGALSSCCHIDH